MTGADVMELGRMTVARPREAARAILDLGFPRSEYWTLFLLTIVLSGALGQLGLLISPVETDGTQPTGLGVATLVGGSILLLAATIHVVGRWFGGTGRFEEALLLMIWLQLVLVAFQAVQTLALFVAPAFAGLIAIAATVLMVWALVNFIAEVHGFTSLGKVFLSMILTLFGLAFALTLLLGAFGVSVGA